VAKKNEIEINLQKKLSEEAISIKQQ